MTINNKTLTTVENLVTSPTTTEGNFRIGVGDALIELNNLNENASTTGISCSKEYIYPGDFTWTAPSNLKIMVQCAGGGGGGGAAAEDDTSNQRAIASGGSGGGYSRIIMDVTTGTQIDLTVGAGGSTASASSTGTKAASGGNGNASTVTIPVIGGSDIVLTANGGGGGKAVETNNSTDVFFSSTSVGGTASGGTVNNQGISSPPATTGSLTNAENFLMFPPGSFTSGFDNSIAITETQARSRSSAAPVQFLYSGAVITESVEFNKENIFGKALNSSISGIAGTGSLIVSQAASFVFADNGILLQSAHATGGAPAMSQCGDSDTGARSATSGAGGDGFVIITVLNI